MIKESMKNTESDKRTLIINSALQIFSQLGYHEAKMDQIAKEAGVGKGTLYLYFSNKEELMREMLKDVISKYSHYVREKMNQEGDPINKLKALYTAHIELQSKSSHFTKFSLNEYSFINNELKQWLEELKKDFMEHLRILYRDGVKQQKFRKMNEEIAIGMMFSIVGAVIAKDINIDVKQVNEILDVLINGIGQK